MNAKHCYAVFCSVVRDYHLFDDVDHDPVNPYLHGTIENLFYTKAWIDSIQWHLEDIIRDPVIDPSKALSIKRRIDRLNQQRTDMVECIDDYFVNKYSHVLSDDVQRHNTESLGWALDRLSILTLKEYHLDVELERPDSSFSHHQNCEKRKMILDNQKKDLLQSINWLMADLEQGRLAIKTYKQLKMYNDADFNPVLYKKINNAI